MANNTLQRLEDLRWFQAGALSAVMALASCTDQSAPLPGGYFISMSSSSEVFLCEPKYGGSILELGTDLLEIGHHNEFIFGRSGAARGTTPGYFLLDSKIGSIHAGLAESDWLRLTDAACIPNPPKLVPPSRQPPVRR
jgi:hypothetical protein